MLALAFGGVSGKFARTRRLGTRFRAFAIGLVDAGAGDMGEGEVRIGRNRPVERLDGAGPGGKHRVMGLAIGRSRRIRGCGERQVVSIAPHGGFSCASRQESIAAAPQSGQPA